jgi:hypothetical protein
MENDMNAESQVCILRILTCRNCRFVLVAIVVVGLEKCRRPDPWSRGQQSASARYVDMATTGTRRQATPPLRLELELNPTFDVYQ